MVKAKDGFRVSIDVSEFDCAPSEITRIAELAPSKVWDRAAASGSRGSARGNLWSLHSDLSREVDLDLHVKRLLEAGAGLRRVREMISDVAITVNCVVHLGDEGEQPILWLSAESIRGMASLGATLGVDYYVVDGER